MTSEADLAVADPVQEIPAAERVVSDACDTLLDQFVIRSEPHLRKLSESVYENLLTDVQEYLKSNANWNLANEIQRIRRVDAENDKLKAQLVQLIDASQSVLRGMDGTIVTDALGTVRRMVNGYALKALEAAIPNAERS